MYVHDNKRKLIFLTNAMLLYVLFWYCTKAFPWSSKFSSHKGVALAMVKHENVRNSHKMATMSALWKLQAAATGMHQKHFPVNCESFATLVSHSPSELIQVFLR